MELNSHDFLGQVLDERREGFLHSCDDLRSHALLQISSGDLACGLVAELCESGFNWCYLGLHFGDIEFVFEYLILDAFGYQFDLAAQVVVDVVDVL